MVVAHRYYQSEANFGAMTIDDQIVTKAIAKLGTRCAFEGPQKFIVYDC